MNELDAELVERFLRDREEQVFRELYRRHTPRLYLFALRICAGNSHNAEEAVQEAWVRAVRSLPHFAWRSTLQTWLCGIVLNCCRETMAIRKLELFEVEPEAQEKDIAASLDLEQLIRRLPDGCREVFILHDIEGRTHDEIGIFLSIAPGTSKSQLFEARKKLRCWLSAGERSKTNE